MMAINSNFGTDTTYHAGRVQQVQLKSYGDAFDPLNEAVSQLADARNKRIEAEKRRSFQAQEAEKVRDFQDNQANTKHGWDVERDETKHGWDVERDETKFKQEKEKLGINHGFRVDEIKLNDDLAGKRMDKKQGYDQANMKTKFDNDKKLLKIKAGIDKALQYQRDAAADARANAANKGVDMSLVPDDIFDTTVMKPTKGAMKAAAELGVYKKNKLATLKHKAKMIRVLENAFNSATDPNRKERLKAELDKAMSENVESKIKGLKEGTISIADMFIEEKFGDDKDKAIDWVARSRETEIDEEKTLEKTQNSLRKIMTLPMKADKRKIIMNEIAVVRDKILANNLAIGKSQAEAASTMVKDESAYNKLVIESEFKSREDYIKSEIAKLEEGLSSSEKAKAIINIKRVAKELFPAKGNMSDEEAESVQRNSK